MKIQDLLKLFPKTVFTVIPEKKQGAPKHFTEYNETLFRKLNDEDNGIYFTPNSFDGRRVRDKLLKLNAVFADLDVSKTGDDSTKEDRYNAKMAVLKWLKDTCTPHIIIDTRNGLQPIWFIDEKRGLEAEKEYKDVIEGIIYQSKIKAGCAGDQVKDVSRVLRLPSYDHMKQEPYKCNATVNRVPKYTLKQLAEIYPKEEKTEEKPKQNQLVYGQSDIDNLDFKSVIIAAYRSVGVVAEFDAKDRVIEDGRLTGTFKSQQGDFLASTSHDPKEGNRITATAMIRNCSNKEAAAWIKEEFNLKQKAVQKAIKKNAEKKIEYAIDEDVKMFTWGTPQLDTEITPMAGQLNLITGGTGMGKTTFSFDVAQKNADLGHKVLYISLEQDKQGIITRLARARAGITKSEWRDRKTIPEPKKKKFMEEVDRLSKDSTLTLFGFGASVEPTIDNIFETIKELKPDLVFIDNFDDIKKGPDEYNEQNITIGKLKDFVIEHQIPINVLHHRNQKKTDKGIGSVRGSGKITDTSWTTLKCYREWDSDSTPKDNARFIIQHEKDREFGTFNMAEVYWQYGTFNDEYNAQEHHNPEWWAEK